MGAECHPDTDLVRPQGDAVADHAVEVDRGQCQRQHRQDEGGELLRQPHHCEVAVHRLGLEDPEVEIQLAPGGQECEPSAPRRSTSSPRRSARA